MIDRKDVIAAIDKASSNALQQAFEMFYLGLIDAAGNVNKEADALDRFKNAVKMITKANSAAIMKTV